MTQQRILYVAPEVNPFLKNSSGSEICAGLPKFIKEYGHEIRVIMPKYKSINDHKFTLRDVIRLKEVPVTVNGEHRVATVKSSFIPDSKVQIYFVEIPKFYEKDEFFENGRAHDDALLELAFFSKAVLELLKILCWFPHIIHTNDWQTSLVHYYLRNDYADLDEYKDIQTIHSIHTVDQHGRFDASQYEAVGLSADAFDQDSIQAYAIKDSTIVTLDNEESLLVYEEEDAFYKPYHADTKIEIIPHGYDDLVWNPQAKKMKQVYTVETIEQKEVNKKYLTHKKDLELPENAPVIVVNIDRDFDYLEEIEDWFKRQENKDVYFVMTSLDKDINRRWDDYDIMGENYVFLKSNSNDDLKNYIAASEFYINLCNRSFYNTRFAISIPFGTIVAGERSQFVDQFISYDEDPENYNSVLVNDIKADFDLLIDRLIEIYKTTDLIEAQRRIMPMLISWTPSGMRIGKIYDNLFV